MLSLLTCFLDCLVSGGGVLRAVLLRLVLLLCALALLPHPRFSSPIPSLGRLLRCSVGSAIRRAGADQHVHPRRYFSALERIGQVLISRRLLLELVNLPFGTTGFGGMHY